MHPALPCLPRLQSARSEPSPLPSLPPGEGERRRQLPWLENDLATIGSGPFPLSRLGGRGWERGPGGEGLKGTAVPDRTSDLGQGAGPRLQGRQAPGAADLEDLGLLENGQSGLGAAEDLLDQLGPSLERKG